MSMSEPIDAGVPTAFSNFGRNQKWRSSMFTPKTEQELLEILRHQPDKKVRAIGSLHSWSDVPVTDAITVNMSAFKTIEIVSTDGKPFVRAGAGCTLSEMIEYIHERSEFTLPTLGAIARQTISGAISTGTHGSGRSSISQYVKRVRIANFDSSKNEACIVEYDSGEKLNAAKCALGCMGILISVDLEIVPKYLIQETVTQCSTLAMVLESFNEHELTQFGLVPFCWSYLAFKRKAVAGNELTYYQYLATLLFRLYLWVLIDVIFHVLVKTSVTIGDPAVKGFMKLTPLLMFKDLKRLDFSNKVLVIGHDYFQHEEMEVFVPQSELYTAISLISAITDVFAGSVVPIRQEIKDLLVACDQYQELLDSRSKYSHHYVIFCRKLMSEDALISMGSSQKEPSFSISLFTYLPPESRHDFYVYCAFIARCLCRSVNARLHWGKHIPSEVENLLAAKYELYDKFKETCLSVDPKHIFCNDFSKRVLKLG